MSTPFESIRKQDPGLAAQLERARASLVRVGAASAAHRLMVAADNAEDLEAPGLFRAIDPARAAMEVEDASGGQARRLGAIRNVLALLPLLLTWIALAVATIEYQAELAKNANNLTILNTPFLVLWERGFGNPNSPFKFSTTASLDFFLLLLVVVFTALAQGAESAALRKTRVVTGQLDEATEALAAATARHTLRLSPDAKPEEWVHAVQKVVDQAMRQTEVLAAKNQEVVDEATKVLRGIHQDTQHLLQQEMAPLVDRFQTNIGDLQAELGRYHQSAADLVTTVQQLGGAATALASNASSYTTVASSIDNNLQVLTQAQTQYVQQYSSSAQHLSQAADSVHALASQMTQDMNDRVVTNLSAASRHLNEVELRLAQTTLELKNAATQLHHASLLRVGVLGRLFGGSD